MFKLVLVRHGESEWNRENRFTGWTDVDLSEKGRVEALEGGRILKQEGTPSMWPTPRCSKRAIRTLWTILDEMGPDVDSRTPRLAPQRTPLWRAARAEQVRNSRQVRKRTR